MGRNLETDNLLWWMDNPEQREKVIQTCADVAALQGGGFGDLLQAISRLCQPYVDFFAAWDYAQPTRAEIRQAKRERRQARHYFMTHGKHGLKRPKGRRNA